MTTNDLARTDAIDVVRSLLDPARLAVAGALAAGSLDIDGLAAATSLDRRRAIVAVGSLRLAGLIEEDHGTYFLATSRLRDVARAVEQPIEPMDATIGYGMTDDERAVLGRSFRGRRLTEIPVNASRRRLVLERLALEFEPGRTYRETTVVDVLSSFHPDHASLRRYLVDEELLERRDGRYWRAGGRTTLPDDDSGEETVETTVVRPFRRADRAAVIELWHRCGLVRPANDPGLDIDRKLAVDDDGFLVAERSGVVVGTVMAGYDGHRGWINYLAVDPASRRSGIGRDLMLDAENLLARTGCAKINLQVRRGNEEAVGFYERLGYALDEVVGMGKQLVDDSR